MEGIEALRHAIDECPLKRQTIADLSGYNNTTINSWLRGETSPKWTALRDAINAAGFVPNITLELPMGRTFWKPADKKEAIRLYSKEFMKVGDIATEFSCKTVEVERMLKAEGQLL